jgi:hypothetical protein
METAAEAESEASCGAILNADGSVASYKTLKQLYSEGPGRLKGVVEDPGGPGYPTSCYGTVWQIFLRTHIGRCFSGA